VVKRLIGTAHSYLFSMPIAWKFQTSMRHRYLIFSIVLFLVIFSAGTIFFVTLMRPIAHKSIKMELIHAVERERFKLEARLNSEIAVVQAMADSLFVRRHLFNPSDRLARDLAFKELAHYSKALSYGDVFWISDRDKKYHFRDKYVYTLDPAEKGSEWYEQALKMNTPFQIKINFDIGLQKTMLWIDAPVFGDNGKPIGLIGIGLFMNDYVNDTYKTIKNADKLYFFNIDGEITGAHDMGLLENKVNIADYFGHTGKEILSVAKTLSETSEINYFEIKNAKLAVAVDSIPKLGWYLVVLHHFTLRESLPIAMTVLFVVMMVVLFACLMILNLYVVKILSPINYLIGNLNRMLIDWELKHHEEDISEIDTLGKFIKMAIIDQLTGVYNRRYFDGQLKTILNSLNRSGGELSLLLIDVDYFKNYNDTYGHDAGDGCLRRVATVLVQCITRGGDFVARYGGEEFVVVLPHTDRSGAKIIADKLLEKIRECNIPHSASDIADRVTISIGGITGSVNHSQYARTYVKQADLALYESKKNGRDRCTLRILE